jgi:alkylhydroperoxidase family enzyme
MAWIKMIPEKNVRNDYLRSLYKKYSDPFEGVDNIIKIHSLNPKSMQLHYDYYKHLMTGKSGLSRMQREMIAVVVSSTNKCHY